MGSSESKSTIDATTPSFTPFSTIRTLSSELKKDQVVFLHGEDLRQQQQQSNSPSKLDFWFCTVENERRRKNMNSGQEQQKEGEKESFTIDKQLHCSGNTRDKDGDIEFWLLDDFNKKYRTRPAKKTEVDRYLKEALYIVNEVAEATIKSRLENMESIERTGAKLMSPKFLPKTLMWSKENTTIADNNNNNNETQQQQTPAAKRNLFYKDSGVFPFLTKTDEKNYGLHAIVALLRSSHRNMLDKIAAEDDEKKGETK